VKELESLRNDSIRGGIPERQIWKAAIGRVLLGIGWILLLLNIVAVSSKILKYYLNRGGTETAGGCLIWISMLATGTCVLSLNTVLFRKNRYGRTATVAAIVIIILLVPLVPSVIAPSSEIAGGEVLAETSSPNSPAVIRPIYEPVTGILYSEDRPSAVVGNQILYEGDSIRGMKVVKIHKDRVEFERDGKRWEQAVAVQETPADSLE